MLGKPLLSALQYRPRPEKCSYDILSGTALRLAVTPKITISHMTYLFNGKGAVLATTEIYDGLTDVLRRVFDDEELVARPDMTADNVDGWDSLSNIRFIMSVEKKFGVKFSAAEVGKLKNVGELAALLASKKS
jgi:acyl carrier protein